MQSKVTKIIFFGTTEFSTVILNQLIDLKKYQLTAVVTQPDQPQGRKKIITPPPVKIIALKNNIKLIQPQNLKTTDANSWPESDIGIVVDYGQIIPEKIIKKFNHKLLNIHPSLLPKYRGPSPIQTALIKGDTKTGITIIELDSNMDHGPIVSQQQHVINPEDTFTTLKQKLALKSANLLMKTIPKYINNRLKPKTQKHNQASYTNIITKQDGCVRWQQSALEIYNHWRALNHWPGIYTKSAQLSGIKNKKIFPLKLINIKPYSDKIKPKQKPGQIFAHNKKLIVACGHKTYIEIIQIQPAGKKILKPAEFINGYLR